MTNSSISTKQSEKNLSFILPCYNAEKYIAECLDSLYSQDIPETDYEVICVNDCSPDGTRNIIVDYQQRHENLVLIDHEKNTRQGGARNTGLRAAQGEYIWFIDPDDYIVPNCLARLLGVIKEENLNLLLFDYEEINEVGKSLGKHIYPMQPQKCNIKDVFLNDDGAVSLCWSKIIKRNVLIDNGLFFYEDFHNEDVVQGIQLFLFLNHFWYLQERIYFYRRHQNSDVSNKALAELQWDYFASQIKAGVEIIKTAATITDDDLRSKLIVFARWHINCVNLKRILHLSNDARKQFYAKLKLIDDLPIIYPYCNFRRKFALRCPNCVQFLHTFCDAHPKKKS
ncbi:MAG: glycosyltransferase family 2 protein [Prevotellaceae bacterium]|jgi:glycosyltransferase involved in cell wall biosynthesis|nr:glycosyltransferase family 2 protein [Prevotellaceae bacterium]